MYKFLKWWSTGINLMHHKISFSHKAYLVFSFQLFNGIVSARAGNFKAVPF